MADEKTSAPDEIKIEETETGPVAEIEVRPGRRERVHLHGPNSRHELKPGDWHAPLSNPGAAAQVPNEPLQPESLQSHRRGIIHDKDLVNPPFGDVDNPREMDKQPVRASAPLNDVRTAESRIRQNEVREAQNTIDRLTELQNRDAEQRESMQPPPPSEEEDDDDEVVEEELESEIDPTTQRPKKTSRKSKTSKRK